MPDPTPIASTVAHPQYYSLVSLWAGARPASRQYTAYTWHEIPVGAVCVAVTPTWAFISGSQAGTKWLNEDGTEYTNARSGSVPPGTMALKTGPLTLQTTRVPPRGLVASITTAGGDIADKTGSLTEMEVAFPTVNNHFYMVTAHGTGVANCTTASAVRTYRLTAAGDTVATHQIGFHRGGWANAVMAVPLHLSGVWKETRGDGQTAVAALSIDAHTTREAVLTGDLRRVIVFDLGESP